MNEFKIKSIDWRRVKGILNRRTMMMCAMIAVLVVTGALSIKYTRMAQGTDAIQSNEATQNVQTQSDAASVQTASDDFDAAQSEQDSIATFFSDYRSERNNVRAQEVAYLDSVIQNTSTDQALLDQAQQRKIALTDMMEKEVTAEGLLRAKGFAQAIVTLAEGSVNVVVSDATLNEAQVAQILQIVQSETGAQTQDVKIIPAG